MCLCGIGIIRTREVEAILSSLDRPCAPTPIYWDQGSVLVQAGLIDPQELPLAGAEVAVKLKDPTMPSNTLIRTRTQTS